eukprot:2412142-Prymnesium_polylepis.1
MSVAAALDQTFEREISASRGHSARTREHGQHIGLRRERSQTRAWSRACRPDAVPFWQTRIAGERR